MKTTCIKNLCLSEGRSKIAAPIAAKSREDILESARQIASLPADLAEWRIDCFENADSLKDVLSLLKEIKEILKEKPVLATIRTANEGGMADWTDEKYAMICSEIAASKLPDAIDVEIMLQPAAQIIQAAADHGITSVASWHNFESTPPAEFLLERYELMQNAHADVLKIAVMPREMEDVLTLMEACLQKSREENCPPLIAISMGEKGLITRIAAETFGSCVSFGSAGLASAPGQIDVETLDAMLDLFHEEETI